MARAKASRSRRPAPAGRDAPPRELAVGRPLQARLVALELHVGLFSAEPRFAADSRFHYPVIVPATGPVPAGMAKVFATEFAALRRLGRAPDDCHHASAGPYGVHCLSYFFYDGFKALVYVEQDGRFVAAWMEEEALQPDSPRRLLAGVDDAALDAFLAAIPGT